jgi:hypothetical protein
MLAAVSVMWASCVPWCGWGYYGQPSAALWKDQLFVAVNKCRSPGGLYRGTFTPTEKRVRDPVAHDNPTRWLSGLPQAQLDIRDDRILLLQGRGEHFIFALADLPLLEDNEFGDRLCELRGYRDQAGFVDAFASDGLRLLFPDHRNADVPDPPRPLGFGDGKTEYVNRVRYALQIAGPKSVRLFHAHNDKLFVSVEPDYLNNWYMDGKGRVAKNLPKPPDRQLRTGRLPADFTETFAVYTVGGRAYLVTTNGKVYMSVPKGKNEVEVTKVWDDAKQKIVGVVQDSANDAVYGWGFVTDSAASERFYMKFDPKPVAVAYKRTVPLWDDRSDAYLESYECARLFRKANAKK